MKKILYIVSTLSRSSPNSQLFSLIKYLDKTKFQPYLITLSPEHENSRWNDYEAIGVKLYSLNLSRIQGVLFAKSKVRLLIEKIKPDLIHTQGIRADILASKLDNNVIKLCTIHNQPQQDYALSYGKFIGSRMLKQHLKALTAFDCCIGVSSTVEKNINRLVNNVKTNNIPNGVDISFYSAVNELQKRSLRKKFSIPENAIVWISSGRLSPIKDPFFLIENWQQKFAESTSNILIILGDGDLYAGCKNLASQASNVVIKGRVNNVVEFLQAADYFISASTTEGLPMAVIEALACGLPILLSDIDPHNEILTMRKNIGMSFNLGDASSFLNALDLIQLQNTESMKKEAIRVVQSKLSAEVMSGNYQKLYSSYL